MGENGPTAEELARAIVAEQEKAKAKKGNSLSNWLGWGGMLLVAPAGAVIWAVVNQSLGSMVCGAAFLMVIVGAIVGTVSKAAA
jgi:hypothetical protein